MATKSTTPKTTGTVAPKPTKGQGTTTSQGAKAPAKTTQNGGKRVVNSTTSQEAEELFDSTIEVHKADGSVVTLSDIDPEAATPAGRKTQPAPKATATGKAKPAPKGGSKAAVAARTSAALKPTAEQTKAAAKLAREKAQVEKDKAALKEQKAELNKKQREQAAQVRKDAAAKLRAERDEKRKLEKEKREADKAEKLAAKARQRGETGNPEQDAAFHETVDNITTLVARPLDTHTLALGGWVTLPGVALDPWGLTLPADLPIGDWAQVVEHLNKLRDVGDFSFGDALVYGAKYGEAYSVIVEKLGIEFKKAKDGTTSSTVKNAKYVASTFPKERRVQGASFTHHLEAASLFKTNPARALNILEQAAAERKPASWVRQQVIAERGDVPTAPQRKAQAQEAIVLASTAQRNEDFELLPNKAARDKFVKEEIDAFLAFAQNNDEVRSEAAVRTLGRIQYTLEEALGELQEWKERALRAEARLLELGEAQARVASYTPTEAIEGEVISPNAEADFLADLAEEGEEVLDLDGTGDDD